MKTIIVTSQKEFDKIKSDFSGEIKITGNLEKVDRSFENAYINVYGSATIKYVSDSATIKSVSDSATIKYVSGSATIESVSGSATITAFGLASILMVAGLVTLTTLGRNIVRYYKNENGLKLSLSKNTTIIELNEFKATLEEYKNMYPYIEKDDKMIFYKSVHKIDNKFIANYDKTTEYKIGEFIKCIVNKNKNNTCGRGLHISHKKWAIDFGRSWNDMSLLELEVDPNDIFVSSDCDGKVRTSKLKVLREVPKEEY